MTLVASYPFKCVLLFVALLALGWRAVGAWPLYHLINLRGALPSPALLEGTRKTSVELTWTTKSKRDAAAAYFTSQFKSPQSILSVLFLVGGDIVQKAIAQMPGGRYTGRFTWTPAVFSFGWVSYAVNSLSSALGDGVFLPPPEHPGCIVSVGDFSKDGPVVGSGSQRENRSWVIGRLMRDLQIEVESSKQKEDLEITSLLVSVYQLEGASKPKEGYQALVPKRDWLWWMFIPAIIVQLVIAAIPLMLSAVDKNWADMNWAILFVTGAGNALALFTASLSSMHKAEFRKSSSRQTYALTRGNGYKHVFLVLPDTTKTHEVGEGDERRPKVMSSLPYLEDMASSRYTRPSWRTRLLMYVSAFLWVLLLFAIAGLKEDTWYLFGSGTIGMAVNVLLAGKPREFAACGIPLIKVEGQKGEFGLPKSIPGATKKEKMGVRDTLMELEQYYPGAGHALKSIFFNGLPTDERDRNWETEPTLRIETARRRLDYKHTNSIAHQKPQNGSAWWNPSEEWLSEEGNIEEGKQKKEGSRGITEQGGQRRENNQGGMNNGGQTKEDRERKSKEGG